MKVNKLLLVVFVLIAIASVIIYKQWTKPHRSVVDEKAISLSAQTVAQAFEENEAKANKDYANNILQLTGKISSVEKNQTGKTVVYLDGTIISKVMCTMQDSNSQDIKTGDNVIIKGICTGYLTDVVMLDCIIVHQMY